MFDASDAMQDPEPTASFDPGVQDALAGADSIGDLVDEVMASLPDQTPTDGLFAGLPGDGTDELVDFTNSGNTDLPELQLPDPTVIEPLIHPDEFTLNGFPYQGQDPTEPGYYSLPSY
jgi:hypothetical protein